MQLDLSTKLPAPQGITIKKAEFNYQGKDTVPQINIELQHTKEFPIENIIDLYYGKYTVSQGYRFFLEGIVPRAVQQLFQTYNLKPLLDSIRNSLRVPPEMFQLEAFKLDIKIIHRFDEWFHSEDVQKWKQQQKIGNKRHDLVEVKYDGENTTYMQILPNHTLKLGDQKLITSLTFKYTGVDKIHTYREPFTGETYKF